MGAELRAVSLRRGNALPGGASRWHHSLLVPGLRAYAVESRGLTLESRALGPTTHGYLVEGRQSRAQVTIVREGELLYRRGGRSYTLGPGDVALDPEIHYDERWMGGRFCVLMLDYDARWGEAPRSFELGRLSAVDRGRMQAMAAALESGVGGSPLDGLLELYRGLGVGLARGRRWEPEPALQELAGALGPWMSRLDGQPMWCDFERATQSPERTLRRRLGGLLELVGVAEPYQGLRPLLKVHRLMTAALLMSAANTSVAEVAAAVGYGSARAYCNAARRAGWATPRATRARTLG